MCQSVNMPVSRLVIATALILTLAQSAQSMPSRDTRQYDQSSAEARRAEEPRENFGDQKGVGPRILQGGEQPRGAAHDAIQYPGDWEPKQRSFVPEPMDSCKGKTFCEDAASYPQEYVSNIISKTESLKLLAGVDRIEVADRAGSSDGGEVLCGSEVKIVYPKTAQNEDKEWRFIVQDERIGYKQGVKIENCNEGTSGNSCKIIEGSIFGYKTSCKQKYVARVLATVHPNGTALTENFKMPSSCCCQIKLVGDEVGSRIGGATLKNQSPAPVKSRRSH